MADYTDIKGKITEAQESLVSLFALIEDSFLEAFPDETEKLTKELKKMTDKLYDIEEKTDELADEYEDMIAGHDRFMDLISQDSCR